MSVESPSFTYAARSTSKDILFAVDIPFPLLRAWYNLVVLKKPFQTSCTCDPKKISINLPSNFPQFTYIELFEFAIPGNSFGLTPDQVVRSEINNSLRVMAAKVYAEYGKSRGRKRQQLNLKTMKFHIMDGQAISITKLKQDKAFVCDELEIKKLYHEMEMAIQEKDEVIENLQSKNEELLKYIDILEKSEKIQHQGKDISDAKKKSRTLKNFLSWAETALWFAKSFGLELESMTVKEIKSNIRHNLVVDNTDNVSGFDALLDDDKGKVEKVLFLLDKFCVGDAFYHEITMLVEGLPKSYLVKQRRDQLNKMCHISATPGEEHGAQLPFKQLLKNRIKEYTIAHPNVVRDNETIKVKISGDGANMTRSSNFILMSFAILQSTDDVFAAKGNHTIAVVKGKEDYDVLKHCFRDVFNDINDMLREDTVNLEFFLGSNYKFILLMMGLSGATSNYACAWCKIHKDERWNMSYDLNHYNSPNLRRTLKEMNELAGKKTKNFCSVNIPLLNIDLDHVILDELHLLLRIMDVLIQNLVTEAVQWDQADNWNKRKKDKKNIHLDNLKSTIRSCGISFEIWEKSNADGKGSGHYDFTSLLGPDKKKLLKELPEKLEGLIRPMAAIETKIVWIKFSIIYSIVTCKTPSEEMITAYFCKAQEWINSFVKLGDKCVGYTRSKVTPYMHAMVYHVPTFLKTVKL